jgi:PTH1 family peptidyl-tRNA hydrolase
MKLIVGLGNVGKQYHDTRHNLGFAVVDMLAISFNHEVSDFKKHPKAAAAVLDCKSEYGCMLVKPTTMMNLSGEAVGVLARYFKIAPADIWVVHDDVDLAFGQMRVRLGGGTAGHNGIKSIIQHIGDGFWRVRLGIANPHLATTPTDTFVLDTFTQDEAAKMTTLLDSATDYLQMALDTGTLSDHTQSLLAQKL